MANEKVKTEGRLKNWWRKHKGTVKVIIGGTVIAGAAVALALNVARDIDDDDCTEEDREDTPEEEVANMPTSEEEG